MREASEVQLRVIAPEAKEAGHSSQPTGVTGQSKTSKWWLRVSVYIVLVLFGQAVAVLLGRFYFVKGGHSKWMATLVQLAGFPILIIYYLIAKLRGPNKDVQANRPSVLVLGSYYTIFGVLAAGDCYLYSIGLQYLPVSTYTLLCASQLAFNSLFSYFLNSQKFTPFVINSVVLLTISSVLLVFNNESENPTGVSKVKYAIGFVCTVAASAGFGLLLSLTQLFFTKILKKHTFKAIMDVLIYQQAVATAVTVVGLFASGEWKGLAGEMNGYRQGKVGYLMNLIWTSISWQVYAIGCVGLVCEVSALFSNSISVLGLPIVPVLSVFFLHDKMDGIKAISMVLAVWGFISYVYQHYLDDLELKAERKNANEVLKGPAVED